MAEHAIQAAVDALASRLRRSVVVIDPTVRLLWASPHYGDEDGSRIHAILQRKATPQAVRHIKGQDIDSWTTPGVIPYDPAVEMKRRVGYPLRHEGRLLGLLLVIDADASMTDEENADAGRVAERLTWPLYLQISHEEDESSRHAALIRSLLDGDRRSWVEARSALGGESEATVLTVRLLAGERDDTERQLGLGLGSWARRQPQQVLHGVVDGDGIVIDPYEGPGTMERARSLVAALSTMGGGSSTVTGIGTRVPLANAARSAEQAELAATAAELFPEFRPVARWADLGCYGVLLRLPGGDLAPEALPAEIRILSTDPRGDLLLRTVEVYLDHGGAGTSAAAELHIHRTSLYYRLHRVEELTGLDLANGRHRLRLHLGVKQARLAAALAARTPP